jgi:hypothetical protein
MFGEAQQYEKSIESFCIYEERNVGGYFNKVLLFLKMVCTSITAEGATLFVPCTLLPFAIIIRCGFKNVHLSYNSQICFQFLHQT